MQINCKYVLCAICYFSQSIDDRIVFLHKKSLINCCLENRIHKSYTGGKPEEPFDVKSKFNGM